MPVAIELTHVGVRHFPLREQNYIFCDIFSFKKIKNNLTGNSKQDYYRIMKVKKFILLCILILFSFTFFSCASLSGIADGGKISYSYKTVEINENQDYLTTKIKYPEFEKLPELNKRIANTVNSNWKNFKSYSKSEWNEIVALNNRGNSKLPSFEYLVTYEVTGNRNIVSVIINTYIFSGGAHGNTTLASFNYDTKSKKFIDVLQASSMSYNEISSICRQSLYKKLINNSKKSIPPSEEDSLREMINTGAFPQAGNFEIFTVAGNKVFVWFEPYSVAPYSYGIQKIQIK
jgi:hypothetical protein